MNSINNNFISNQKENFKVLKNLSLNEKQRPKTGYELNTYSTKQKLFTTVHPIKPYKRFIEIKDADLCIDPNSTFRRMIKKDVVQPICHQNSNYIPSFSEPDSTTQKRFRQMSAKWAVGTTKKCNNIKNISKFQQFTEYKFNTERNSKDIFKYRNKKIDTDHISLIIPEIKRTGVYLKTKGGYSTQSPSNSYWEPFNKGGNLNNLSSRQYNIINFLPNKNNMIDLNGLISKPNMTNKTKGVSEFKDLTRDYRPNYSKAFADSYKENPKRFFKTNGIFSFMCDIAMKKGDPSIIQQTKPKI